MNLSEVIKRRIINEGPVSFRDYMEMALYYPELGYYTCPGRRIGKEGDFYTSPYLSSLFGEMIAKQLEEMWMLMGKNAFTIVEYGAGEGLMCRDILKQLSGNCEMYNNLQYVIIEKSNSLKKIQQGQLGEKVSWYEKIEDIGGFQGCVLANEVLDNFAVHQVVMQDELKEVYVDYNDGFTEVYKTAPSELKDYFKKQGIDLPAGFRTEVNLQAEEWLKDISLALNKGYVMTIDYGYGSAELYSPPRSNGTLLCYHKHVINDEIFKDPGSQDITAHVNFSALKLFGEKYGLSFAGYTNQARFLLALGLSSHLAQKEIAGKDNPKQGGENLQMIQVLLTQMGRKMKLLVQVKDAPLMLSGLQIQEQLI